MLAQAHFFFSELRHRWVEYVLGALVIATVTSTLVLQRSVTASTGEQVHDLAHRLGKNMLVVPAEASPAEFYALRYGEAGMPDDYPDRIRRSALGKHIRAMQARLNGNVEVNGISLILSGERSFRALQPQGASGPAAAELGIEAAHLLNVRPGDEILVRKVPLLVTRIRARPPDGLGMGVFTSLATAQHILNRPRQINSMRLGGCWCKLDVPTLGSDVEKLLPGARAITVAGVLKAQKGTVAVMERYALALYAIGILLVGGTVLALISSQVRRSMREIGLLVAVGASKAMVQTSLITKAALVGAAGGMLGYFAGGWLTTAFGSRLLHIPLEPPPGLWALALGLCVLVSAAAAALPARRVARLDPTEVLRED